MKRKILVGIAAVLMTIVPLAQPAAPTVSEYSEAEIQFIEWHDASPENTAWFEWVVFMQDPANAAWFEWMIAPKPQARASTPYSVWDRLAECESHGEWNYGPHSTWGSRIYHGGLQFHPDTWSAYRLPGYPTYAYQATREQQIAVGERVLAAQGWRAWPACSLELGLR